MRMLIISTSSFKYLLPNATLFGLFYCIMLVWAHFTIHTIYFSWGLLGEVGLDVVWQLACIGAESG
jgi:hypothetical protein